MLTLITHQSWRASDFTAHAISTRLDYGFDAGSSMSADTLWAPGVWAAAAVEVSPRLRFMSAGADWLSTLDGSITRRMIAKTVPARDARMAAALYRSHRDAPMFVKLPETKDDRFPAGVYASTALPNLVHAVGPDEPIQVQEPIRFHHDQVRCWVLNSKVVAVSGYSLRRPREDYALIDSSFLRGARDWLTDTLPKMGALPTALVIDVGLVMREGKPDGFAVIEANAAWSSDWYSAEDMDAVLRTIAASQGRSGKVVPDHWLWRPTPMQQRMARGIVERTRLTSALRATA